MTAHGQIASRRRGRVFRSRLAHNGHKGLPGICCRLQRPPQGEPNRYRYDGRVGQASPTSLSATSLHRSIQEGQYDQASCLRFTGFWRPGSRIHLHPAPANTERIERNHPVTKTLEGHLAKPAFGGVADCVLCKYQRAPGFPSRQG